MSPTKEMGIVKVSIHAPLARSNTSLIAPQKMTAKVSIHAPLARSNPEGHNQRRSEMFQYMLLLRGATQDAPRGGKLTKFQYMLLLRGATRTLWRRLTSSRFQYMLLLRGATIGCIENLKVLRFNTCSSCEEQLLGYF